MARGSIYKRCKICRKQGNCGFTNCNHKEAVYIITYRFGRKQKWETVGPNRKDAGRHLADIMAQIGNGAYFKPKEIVFEDFAKKWLEDYAAMRVKPSSFRNYRDAI